MSISDEVTRLVNAKSSIRSKLNLFGVSIPENKLLSEFPDYLVLPGVYVDPPAAAGFYIKYIGGYYSNYDNLVYPDAVLGISVKTSSCSFTLHPSVLQRTYASFYVEGGSYPRYINSSNDVSYGIADYTQGPYNTAYLAGKGTSAADAVNLLWNDGSTGGYVPSGGELNTILSNANTINYTLTLIGEAYSISSDKSYLTATVFRKTYTPYSAYPMTYNRGSWIKSGYGDTVYDMFTLKQF